MAAGAQRENSVAHRYEENVAMSAFPFGSSFGSEPRVLQQMRGQRSRGKKLARVGTFDPVRRHALIAEAAYYRAQRRGFAPGHELEDWLEAEAELARVS
jgi:Protein of unknown function (DUF2934)